MQKFIDITVKRSFVTQCNKRAEIYGLNGRTKAKQRRDIEAEIYEWYMIDIKQAKDHDSWKVDMILPNLGAVDVKLIGKYYNSSCQKFLHILQQKGTVDNYVFIQWVKRPERNLKTGDRVRIKILGHLSHDQVCAQVKTSRFNGYYVDVHKFLGTSV